MVVAPRPEADTACSEQVPISRMSLIGPIHGSLSALPGRFFTFPFAKTCDLGIFPVLRKTRAVAQLGSALEWGSRGRGFESRRPDV
jgi:hypothetical protein